MRNKNYPDPFFRITHKKTGKRVKICLGPFLNDSLRYLRNGSINDLLGKIFFGRYDKREIEKEIELFEDKISKFAYYAENRGYIAYGNGVKDKKALENTFKLNIYTGMALQELRDVLQNIVDKEKKFSNEMARAEEIRNEILKIKTKLVNSILDLIYNENLPPANALEELEMPNIRKLNWLSSIICAVGEDSEYGNMDLVNDVISKSKYKKEEAGFKRGEPRKYTIPANMKIAIVIEEGLNNKEGPQAMVGIEEVSWAKLEKEFYLFDDFTNRQIKMFKKNIDNLFNEIVTQEDDPIKFGQHKITLANLRDDIILFVFTLEDKIKKVRRDYKKALSPYCKYAIDEKAVEVSRMLHIKFIELIEDMRVLLLRYVNGGINLEELLTGYLEKRVALREYIAKEILKVDLSKYSVLDFIDDEIGGDKPGKLSTLKIKDPKLEKMCNNYIKEKERLGKYVSDEISKRGSLFDHLYVKVKAAEKYFNPHDDFIFPDESEKYIKKIKERAEELAKKENDRNEAYIKACEEIIKEAVEKEAEEKYDEEINPEEKLYFWRLSQKLLYPAPGIRPQTYKEWKKEQKERENEEKVRWQAEVEKAKKEMPPDKESTREKINTDIPGFAPNAEEFINYSGEGLEIGKKSYRARAESIHRIVVGVMEGRSRLTASSYIKFMTKLEDSEGTGEEEYAKKVIGLVEKVKPTESELQEYINNITVDEIGRFSNRIDSMGMPREEDRRVARRLQFIKEFEIIIKEIRKELEKIKNIKGIYLKSLINEEDIESAIESAKEKLEELK